MTQGRPVDQARQKGGEPGRGSGSALGEPPAPAAGVESAECEQADGGGLGGVGLEVVGGGAGCGAEHEVVDVSVERRGGVGEPDLERDSIESSKGCAGIGNRGVGVCGNEGGEGLNIVAAVAADVAVIPATLNGVPGLPLVQDRRALIGRLGLPVLCCW